MSHYIDGNRVSEADWIRELIRIQANDDGSVTLHDRQGPFLTTSPESARELLGEKEAA